jgi:hypothetical protein
MRRLVLSAFVLAPVVVFITTAPAALDHHLDPQHHIVAADQARAQSLLIRKTDLRSKLAQQVRTGELGHVTCRAYDQSDVIVTGDAGPQTWAFAVGQWVTSASRIYSSQKDADTVWSRGTGHAALRCIGQETVRRSPVKGARLISLKRIAFPHVAPRVVATRMVVRYGLLLRRVTTLTVALQRSRAQVVVSAEGIAGEPSINLVRLARLVSARMATAMRRT